MALQGNVTGAPRAGGLMNFDIGGDLGVTGFQIVESPVNTDVSKSIYSPSQVLSYITPPLTPDQIVALLTLRKGHPLFDFNDDTYMAQTLAIIAEFGQLYREKGVVTYEDGTTLTSMLGVVYTPTDPVPKYTIGVNGDRVFTQFNLGGRLVTESMMGDNGIEVLFDNAKGFQGAYTELLTYINNQDADQFIWTSSSLNLIKKQVDALNDAENEVEASDEIGYCNKCKSRWLTHKLLQTRSGDEALTNIYRCAACTAGKHYLHIYSKDERDAYRAAKKAEAARKKAEAELRVITSPDPNQV